MVGRSITHKIKHSYSSFVSMVIPQMTKLVLLFIAWGSLLYLSSGIPSEFSITGFDPEEFSSNDNSFVLFQKWSDKYGKMYETLEDLEKRFQVFKRNLNFITQHNSQRSATSYQLGLNEFADLSPEEFKRIYLTIVPPPNTTHVPLKNPYCPNRPATFDWRDRGVLPQVKNQEQCGSCWAFSAAAAMESKNAIVTGRLISISEQALVDCDLVSYGCGGGWVDEAFTWVIGNGGIDSEASYPYTAKEGTCKTSEKAVTIDGYKKVAQSEDDILCSLLDQPLSVYVDAASSSFQFYAGGILNETGCSNDPYKINHAVLIVGYGSENGQEYWIVRNSWGQSWGLNGHIKIKRNAGIPNGVCAINSWVYFPIKNPVTYSSTSDTYPNIGYNNHYEE